MKGNVEVRFFMFLAELCKERNWPVPMLVEVEDEISGPDFLRKLDVPIKRVEVLLINGKAVWPSEAKIRPGDRVASVVGEVFPRIESRETTHHPVSLDGGDMALPSTNHPLTPLHGDRTVAPVANGDEVDEGMRLILQSRKIGCMDNPVDHGLESFKKPRLHSGTGVRPPMSEGPASASPWRKCRVL